MHKWFGLSDPPIKEALHDMALCREVAHTVIDATLIAAPTSTKNSTGERDPEMNQTKKGRQWHHGIKAQRAQMLILVLFIRLRGRRPTHVTSTRRLICCMVRRQMSLEMPATKEMKNARRLKAWMFNGMWPCARASDGWWTSQRALAH
jgi:hypothetical protein